jgi:alpha-1,2-mannosyltransferase
VSLAALLESRPARTVSVALWGVSVVALALQTLHKAHRPLGNDLTMYLDAAQALLAGRNPYTLGGTLPYMYPLFLAAVLAPLTAMPRDAATLLWFVASVGSLVLAARVTGDLARETGIVRSGVSLTVPLVALWFLLFDPIQNNLLNGQVNFQILLLCVLCLKFYFRGRPTGSAAALAPAIAVKLTPALLLGFLAARRRWTAIVLCLGLSAFLVLAPIVLPGAEGGRAYRAYAALILLPRLHTEFPTAHRGVRFSVNGVLEALRPGWDGVVWRRALGASLPLAGLALVELLARRRESQGRDVWIFSLYLLVQPLVTPLSEVHHLVYAFPAAGLLALGALPIGSGPPAGGHAAGLAAVWLLLVGGRLDRDGPWFFLALCLVGALATGQALTRAAAPDPERGGRVRAP